MILTLSHSLAIINEHYATLGLKPMNKLDFYLPFNEIPGDMGFFRQVLRVVVSDYMSNQLNLNY